MTGFEFSKVVTTMKYENKTAAYEPSLLAGIEIAAEDLKVVVSPSPVNRFTFPTGNRHWTPPR